jgi:hypothetical protein
MAEMPSSRYHLRDGAREMQNLQEVPFKYRLTPKRIARIFRFLWRYRKQPEALEPFLASAEAEGVPEPNLSNVRSAAAAWREVYLDHETIYRVDRYLVVGVLAIDVVLIPVILPMGVPDRALFVALLSLVISLVFAAWSLVTVFIKSSLGIKGYGHVHGGLIFVALVSGMSALAATIWHSSVPIAVVLIILAPLAYFASLSYMTLGRLAIAFLQIVEAMPNPPSVDPNEPNRGTA